MHMSDALISPAVAGVMATASAGLIAYSVYKTKDELEEKKIPLMGVMGAFVFAAQMINFTIPGTGSSGHIGGGLLLSSILGPAPAFLVMSTVLIIQALFFADGGILALGCNIFNMGFYACMIAYPLIFKPIMKKGFSKGKIIIASILASVIGLQLGAFSVVIETLLSGRTELPFTSFVLLMQPIHLAIGIGEGIITAGVLCFIHSARPEILEYEVSGKKLGLSINFKKVTIIMVVLAALVGGILSLYASSYPDGLEWSMGNIIGEEELQAEGETYKKAEDIQKTTSFMPDYNFKNANEDSSIGTSVAGIIGGAITLIFAFLIGFIISKIKKNKTVMN